MYSNIFNKSIKWCICTKITWSLRQTKQNKNSFKTRTNPLTIDRFLPFQIRLFQTIFQQCDKKLLSVLLYIKHDSLLSPHCISTCSTFQVGLGRRSDWFCSMAQQCWTRTRGICDVGWGQVGVARMQFWLFDGASSGESCLLLMLRAFPELLKDATASHWPHRRNKSVPVLKWRSLNLQAFLPLISGLITCVAYRRGGSQSVCWQMPLDFPRSILWRLKICLIPRKWLFTLYFEIINRPPE